MISEKSLKTIDYKSIALILWKFSLPLILSGILQQLYLWADAIIIGHFVGEDALGAIGVTGSITNSMMLVMIGFTTGLSVIAAQKFGAGDRETVSSLLSHFSLLLTGAFLLLSVAGIFCCDDLLRLLQTPSDILSYAEQYLRIILMGIPFLTVYNLYAAMLRAVGNSKASFYAVMVSSVANVLLDLLLVAVFPFGVQGAALATILSQIAMTVFLVRYAEKKYDMFRFERRGFRLQMPVIALGLHYAVPLMIQQSITAIGGLVLQGFMNGFGARTVAAITSAYRVDLIMLIPIMNLGAATSTMVAQNKGAGDREKVKGFSVAGTALCLLFSVFLMFLMYNFGGHIVRIFGIEEEAVKIGAQFFRSISLYYLVYGLSTAFRGIAEGYGKVAFSGVTGILALFVRIGLSFLLKDSLGNRSIAHAEGLHWVFLTLVFLPVVWNAVRKKETESASF